jgi:hypothetical protein
MREPMHGLRASLILPTIRTFLSQCFSRFLSALSEELFGVMRCKWNS